MSAHRGTTVAGFPNFFIMPGPNTGTGHTSQVFTIETQIRHVIAALQRMDERGACTSWYLDPNGPNTTLRPYSSLRFRSDLREIEAGEFRFDPPRHPVRDERHAGHHTAWARAS